MKNPVRILLGLAAYLLAVAGGYAVIPVSVDADATWPLQLQQWGKQLSSMTDQINHLNQMISQGKEMAAIVGNPKSALQSISTVHGALEQFSLIFDDQNGTNTRGLLSQADNLKYTVGQTMVVAKQPVSRNPTLYDAYRVGNSLSTNLRKVLDDDNAEQKRLAERRKAIMDEMASKQAAGTLTQSDLQQYEVALNALKGQQDGSAQVVANAQRRMAEEDAQRHRNQEMAAIAAREQTTAEAAVVKDAMDKAATDTDAATGTALKPSQGPWQSNSVDQRTFGGGGT